MYFSCEIYFFFNKINKKNVNFDSYFRCICKRNETTPNMG